MEDIKKVNFLNDSSLNKNEDQTVATRPSVETSNNKQDDMVENQPINSPTNNSVKIHPQIPADSIPLIVLCGPPSSGKSMVLKSLAAYLDSKKYDVVANRTLLNTDKYKKDCDFFNSMIKNYNIRMPNTVDYLLVDVMDDRGRTLAHFLEAPGEDFFSITKASKEPDRAFEPYMDKIAEIQPGNKRKVIYIILLDLDSPTSFRNDKTLREKYEKKMVKLYESYVKGHLSRVILLYNKADLLKGASANTSICGNLSQIVQDAKVNYPRLFFKKKFLFWDIEDYSLLPYCTGSYYDDSDGYTAPGTYYPENLWKEITKLW